MSLGNCEMPSSHHKKQLAVIGNLVLVKDYLSLIKNKLTMTREEGVRDNRGKKGKGQVKKYTKGLMAKDNGNGQVEGAQGRGEQWGKSGDNCN